MGPVRIGVGTEWLLDGRAWRVVRQLSPERFIAQDVKFLVEQEFTQDQILLRYAQGELRLAPEHASESSGERSKSSGRSFRDFSRRDKRIVERRWHALEPLTKLGRPPSQDDFAERTEQLNREGVPCSARTLRRYWKCWHDAGKDRMALLPRTGRSGGPGRSRRNGFLEKHPPLKRLVEDAIQNVYLNKARRPVSAVTRRVLEDLQRLNARLPAAQAVPIPREAALTRAIARRISQMDSWEVDRQRWGRKIADRRHKPTTARRLATRILERVEIDHSPLKVVVGVEAGPIGQPWLTVLIDYYSRLIVGFCLGFEPPSYAVIMEALRHAILPKAHVKERYPRVQGTWPCFGVPEKLVCDRGPDLTSRDLEEAAFQLGMELDFNPPRTPHLKGSVESFFDGLNDQMAASLPGRTFRSWERRADYNPDDGPLLTYEGLLEIVHIHLVDVYSVSRHPAATKTRLEMWQESAAEHPPCLPASADDLVVMLAKRVDRVLSPRGIELSGMFYTSDELMALRAELASGNHHGDRVQVRYNPWDLGDVWVRNPVDGTYVKAAAIDTAMRGMTAYQWKVLKRAVRERFDRPEHLLSLAAGRNAIRDVVEEALQKPSRRRRVRAARFLSKPRTASNGKEERGEDGGLDAASDSQHSNLDPSACDSPDSDGEGTEPRCDSRKVTNEQPPLNIDADDIDVDDWDVTSS